MPPKRSKEPLTPKQVAARLGGSVLFELLWTPMEAGDARKGAKKIREIVEWAYEHHNKKMPGEVEEMLRWLRDHFGSQKERTLAREQHRMTS